MDESGAERTLNLLLDPQEGLTPNAELDLPGIVVALDLRAEMGHLAGRVPAPEKYVDGGYYREAVAG